jgi:hypothetical protein
MHGGTTIKNRKNLLGVAKSLTTKHTSRSQQHQLYLPGTWRAVVRKET